MHRTAHAHADADAHRCLALTIYWEARSESDLGMYAVGSVVMNRVVDPRFPGSVCKVVKQGGETPPCQFSWWCDGRSDRPTDQRSWRRATDIAGQLLRDRQFDPTHGALYFHSATVRPGWRLRRVARLGTHIFCR